MPQPDTLTALRDYLVSQGIVRIPRVAGTAPPMWLEPRNGTPAPGAGDNPTEVGDPTVLAAFLGTGIAPKRHEGFIRTDAVTIWVRTRTAPLAHQIEKQLRAALNDKRGWAMAGLQVNESLLFRDLQRVGFDNQGYSGNTEYFMFIWE